MLKEKLRVACLQYCATDDLSANLEIAAMLLDEACEVDAEAIFLPEACDFLGKNKVRSYAMPEDQHSALGYFRDQARKRGVWLFPGSLSVRDNHDTVANRSFVIDPSGAVVARYDKIHMFDAAVPGHEVSRESDTYQHGNRAVVLASPWGGVGLSICYDLRFPHLYRTLSQGGARILTVPAAFTQNSGKAHWQVLLRSRAIENGCFVIAAGQCGSPYEGRCNYGHSLIVGPWGEVLAEAGDGEQVICAELDFSAVEKAREAISSLQHDKDFSLQYVD